MGGRRADHAEDVTGHVDRKLAALEAHESQFESTMHAADDGELDAFRRRVRDRLAEHGDRHGLATPSCSRYSSASGDWPSVGGPANAWAIAIHSVASGPVDHEVGVVAVAALGHGEAEPQRAPRTTSVDDSLAPQHATSGSVPARRGPSPAGTANPRFEYENGRAPPADERHVPQPSPAPT